MMTPLSSPEIRDCCLLSIVLVYFFRPLPTLAVRLRTYLAPLNIASRIAGMQVQMMPV